MRRTERWFAGQGVPQLIADYGFRKHVLPRLVPTLGVGAALAVTGGLLGAAAGAPLPVVVAAAAVGFAAWSVLAVTALAYGLVPLAAQATRHAWADMRASLRLQGRALPTLLFVTFFLFFTSELWQLMNHLAWGRLVLVLLLFAAVTVLATSTRLRAEVDRVEHDLNPDRLANACAGTPLGEHVPAQIPTPTPLTPRQERNLLLVLATRQLVQAAVVGVGLFGFFVLLGAIVVDDHVASLWIMASPRPSPVIPSLPAALFRAAALLAGFGSMYFAITTMTQTEYRSEFFDPVIGDVERMLAVRAVYLALRGAANQPTAAALAAPPAPLPVRADGAQAPGEEQTQAVRSAQPAVTKPRQRRRR